MTKMCFVSLLILTHTLSCWMAGQTPKASGYTSDIESGKEKFLAAQHSPTERDYVARYGQKAYRTVSGGEAGSMPQPLTPGHTATVKIKALTEQEAAAPGGALSLLLLAFQPFGSPSCLPVGPCCQLPATKCTSRCPFFGMFYTFILLTFIVTRDYWLHC